MEKVASKASVPKLEGLWWVEGNAPALEVPRSEWCWKLLIRMPEFVTKEMMLSIQPGVAKKKKNGGKATKKAVGRTADERDEQADNIAYCVGMACSELSLQQVTVVAGTLSDQLRQTGMLDSEKTEQFERALLRQWLELADRE